MPSSKFKDIFWSITDIVGTIAVAVAAVLVIRTFIVQPFLVSGESMEPNFAHGDYLIVDELSYRFQEPKRGDVVVFEHDSESFFIKRIMAVPGETIAVRSGKVRILQDGEWSVLQEPYVMPSRTFGDFEVNLGPDEFFVMGDNRNLSFDSRRWGPLQRSNIVGLVRLRLWPLVTAQAISSPAY